MENEEERQQEIARQALACGHMVGQLVQVLYDKHLITADEARRVVEA